MSRSQPVDPRAHVSLPVTSRSRALIAVAAPALGWLALAVCSDRAAAAEPTEPARFNCQSLSDYTKDAKGQGEIVVIDANRGTRLLGDLSHGPGKQMALVFVNQNPIRYQYRYDVVARSVEGSATTITHAFSQIGIPTGEDKEDAKATPAAPAPTEVHRLTVSNGISLSSRRGITAHSAPSGRCTAAEVAQLNRLKSSVDLTEQKRGIVSALREQARLVRTEVEALRARQKAVFDVEPASGPASVQLCLTSRDTLGETEQLLGRKSFASQAGELIDAKERLDAEIAATDSVTPTQGCAPLFEQHLANAAALQGAVAGDLETIGKDDEMLAGARKEFLPFAEVLRSATTGLEPFRAVRTLGASKEAMEYDISIVRTDRAQSAVTTIKIGEVLKVGVPAVSYSAGIAASFSDQRTFNRQTSADAEVVGVSEESDAQVGVVGQANVRLRDFGPVSFGLSLGASITDGDDDTQFGFFAGPTFGLLDDRLFLTVAYHLHKETHLSAGFAVGDEVPEGFEGEIPTTEETEGGLLVSFTYRLR